MFKMFLIYLTIIIAPLTIFCRDELEEVCEEVEEEECALQDEQVCQQVSGGGRGGEGLGGWVGEEDTDRVWEPDKV